MVSATELQQGQFNSWIYMEPGSFLMLSGSVPQYLLVFMTIFIILRQNDHFETFALLFHQLF